ncbi:MAG: hypothetical protein KJO31_12405 [Gammaproteobacteria bacterium]|nr:hypothetical protein [Gammaproteobacteria bacterium]
MTLSSRWGATNFRAIKMENPKPEDRRVRPEFAAVVFGVPAAIILFDTVIGPASLYEYLAGFAWAGSLFALAIRGFWNEERNAFAPVENNSANLAPVLLAIFGIVALLESERVPGVFLLVLAVAWTFAAPSWRPLWKSKPVRFIGGFVEIVQAIVLIAVIAMLVWSWLGK